MRTVVQFDMDGVLADFSSGYDRVCALLGVPAPGPDAPWDAKWDAKVWGFIRTSRDFWRELDPLVGLETLARVGDLRYQRGIAAVYFVTNRPGTEVKRQTERWLELHGVYAPTVILSGRKGEFARAAGVTHAIDDKAGNAVYTAYESPETASYLIDRPYNAFDPAVLGSKVKRISTVEAFLDDVEGA